MMPKATTALVALAHFAGRASLLVAAIAFARGHDAAAVAFGVVASAAVVAERWSASWVRSAVETLAATRALRAAFASERVVATSTTAQATVLAGATDEARFAAEVVPAVAADALALVVYATVAITNQDLRRLGVALASAAVSLLLVVALQSRVRSAAARAWQEQTAHMRRVLDGFAGAEELVAAGRAEAFESLVLEGMQRARAAGRVVAAEAALLGRFPLVVAVTLTALAAQLVDVRVGLGDWALVAAVLAPFGGLGAAGVTYAQTLPARRAIAAIWNERPRGSGTRTVDDVRTIRFSSVAVAYEGRPALVDVTVALERGITVLKGGNGSGKTTLLRAIAGLVPLSAGTASFDDVAIADIDWKHARARMSVLSQRPFFPTNATVEDALRLFGPERPSVRRALEDVGMWSVLTVKAPDAPTSVAIDELSAGERQRIALARTFARAASIYLLDEPDANLDRSGVDMLGSLLERASKDAIVIVSAHGTEIAALADRTIDLDQGRVVTSGHALAAARAGE